MQHTATHCNTHAESVFKGIESRLSTHCSTLQHTATHTLQHTATHALEHTPRERFQGHRGRLRDCQRAILESHSTTHCKTLQHTATRCNTLQHTATHCNTLQRTSRAFSRASRAASQLPKGCAKRALASTRQHTAKHCNTLQHTATHCNAPQERFPGHRGRLRNCRRAVLKEPSQELRRSLRLPVCGLRLPQVCGPDSGL